MKKNKSKSKSLKIKLKNMKGGKNHIYEVKYLFNTNKGVFKSTVDNVVTKKKSPPIKVNSPKPEPVKKVNSPEHETEPTRSFKFKTPEVSPTPIKVKTHKPEPVKTKEYILEQEELKIFFDDNDKILLLSKIMNEIYKYLKTLLGEFVYGYESSTKIKDILKLNFNNSKIKISNDIKFEKTNYKKNYQDILNNFRQSNKLVFAYRIKYMNDDLLESLKEIFNDIYLFFYILINIIDKQLLNQSTFINKKFIEKTLIYINMINKKLNSMSNENEFENKDDIIYNFKQKIFDDYNKTFIKNLFKIYYLIDFLKIKSKNKIKK